MNIYVAGCLREKKDRDKLEEVEKVCRKFGETYLTHRDKGLFKEGMEPEPIFKENRNRVDWCDIIIAVLDWK